MSGTNGPGGKPATARVEQSGARRHSPIVGGIDVREIARCTCLGLRRSARSATQLYDAHLAASGLTIGQFGILAQLYGIGIRRSSIAIRELASIAGMDPTTLNRTLAPLEERLLVASSSDARDRRVRLVSLTRSGKRALASATPRWQAAQRQLRDETGPELALALDGILALFASRVPG